VSRLRATDALRAVVASLTDRVHLDRVDRVWIFPAKEIGATETGFLVLSLVADEPAEAGQRQLLTIRYEAERARSAGAPRVEVTEEGRAPADRVARIIRGVVERLEAADEPAEYVVQGDPDRWSAVLGELAASEVDPPNRE